MHGFAGFRRAVCVTLFCALASAARADSCPTAGAEPVVLASVAPRLELKLADGRLVRLAGLEAAAATPTTPDRDAAAVASLASIIGRHAIAVTILSPKPDRWGRLPAFASIADGADAGRPGGLAVAALATGLARYRPEAVAQACRAALLAAEETARGARLGLWADPFYSVLAADDRGAFAERVGTNVVLEARLRAVEPGTYRTSLRFDGAGTTGAHDRRLEATIIPRTMKTFAARGVDLQALIGRTLRVRGLLDQRFGPRIELAGPDDIEILPESAAPARPN